MNEIKTGYRVCSSSCTEKQKKIVQLGHTRKPVFLLYFLTERRRITILGGIITWQVYH